MKKTNYPQFKSQVTAILVTLCLLFTLAGCEEGWFFGLAAFEEPVESNVGPDLSDNIQTFRIGPRATVINAFEGLISIEIPDDAVTSYVNVAITKGLSVAVDSLMLFPTSFKVMSENVELLKPIVVVLNYDPSNLDCKNPYDESCLKIYSLITAAGEDQFSDTDNMGLLCGNDCCVDCTNKRIRACFNSFGTFVAGMGR